ncbi:outer membrane protein assembly factor BamA [Maritimibacter alkaliphilus]|uniref:outer membrane protein assembly factor BamA n=1 Tax=Maritimibacter alkaliphilus TaxID=404236 RepID=UPI001C93ED50|nr:outer membrane protein assembly factor BamA [Maritimibacter alkaliphilus]MBY6089478.1 outer membrane protein assembly factor BamA [Maritimibacter alkaliphilus]
MPHTTSSGARASKRRNGAAKPLLAALLLGFTGTYSVLPDVAVAQSYTFSNVTINGNDRISAGTILSYAGIARGQAVSGGQLNDAYQRILASGLFESVDLEPRGGTLVINVVEFPIVNRISFEGNTRKKDEELTALVKTQTRRVFSPSQAESDANAIAEAYSQSGRLAARVTPKIIKRDNGTIDLVYEVFEGGNVEVERISFVGNEAYSDGRLRRVLQSKQAGLLRVIFQRDTFVEDRLNFDKQVLTDFYNSRGYVDFRVTGLNAELARERDGYFVTFTVEEGQQFRIGNVSVTSEMEGVNPAVYEAVKRIKPGVVFSPSLIETDVARMERQAIKDGVNFMRVEPVITRNDRDQTLDINYKISRGPRIFIERIDIEGNTTTLDRVVRRQFRVVEGDPFNPREIRESAERIRALGFFANASVNAREGSSPDQVIVDVNVEETTTGSLSFGGTYSTANGVGLAMSLSENNFLGRGQRLGVTFSGATDLRNYGLTFSEPAFLGRDVRFDFRLAYTETEASYTEYDTSNLSFSTGLTFPMTDRTRLNLAYKFDRNDMSLTEDGNPGQIISDDIAEPDRFTSALGYTYTYDSRLTGLNPNAGVLLEFGQDVAGLGGDSNYVRTTARAIAQTKVFNEEVTLRATFRAGALSYFSGDDGITTDRFTIGNSIMRGFEPKGIGPREVDTANDVDDALGGNFYAVGSFEAEFPLGLPEEYGMTGGVFYDVGSLWGLNKSNANVLYEDASLRHVIGVSLFWTTPIGPLRLNWSKALVKEDYDKEQTFDLTIQTDF